MRTWRKTVIVGALVALSLHNGATAQPAIKLVGSDVQPQDRFGWAVSISGDVAVTGIYAFDGLGAAYVYRWNGASWVEEQKLVAWDGIDEADLFGEDVAVSQDVVAVGAASDFGNNNNSGAVYVFRRVGSSWVPEEKILPVGAVWGEGFGSSVAILGDVMLVGAPLRNGGGAAYILRWNGSNWVQEQRLLAPDGEPNDEFGYSVSLSVDRAVVGARRDYGEFDDAGSAHVFRDIGSSWIHEQKLVASDPAADERFGRSVSISGDVVAVGAAEDDDFGEDSGSVFVFRRQGSSWSEEQKLFAEDAATGDLFGWSIAASPAGILVAAPWDDDRGPDSGSAYFFQENNGIWEQSRKIGPSEAVAQQRFGYAVALAHRLAFIGAPMESDFAGASFAVAGDCDPGSGFYGPMCLPCPGGAENACSGHGVCDDGPTGSGACSCDEGHIGVACAVLIPAASTWGLITLMLLLTTGGTMLLRRLPIRS